MSSQYLSDGLGVFFNVCSNSEETNFVCSKLFFSFYFRSKLLFNILSDN